VARRRVVGETLDSRQPVLDFPSVLDA